MKLLADKELEHSAVVANCRMNRERNLHGTNGYERELRFDSLEHLRAVVDEQGQAKWLDLCCGTGKALVEASAILDAEQSPVTIVGVDLVGIFDESRSPRLRLIEASLTSWEPQEKFDLITCVHGLHYIGDKLRLISRAASWLSPDGTFIANLDKNNLSLSQAPAPIIIENLRKAGFSFTAKHRVLKCDGSRRAKFPFRYLGADDQAGPNYTGQAAVNSHYALVESSPEASGHAP